MKINFSNKNGKGSYHSSITKGNFEDMMKQRKKHLPEIQKTIQEALQDYSGEGVCIILMKEDENGLPDHAQVVMSGTTRMESQIAMSRALNDASQQAMKMLMDSADGDLSAMLKIAAALAKIVQEEE